MIEFSSKIRVDRVTLYYLKVEVKREFSYGSWPRRFHCIVELEADGMFGYGEICIPETDSQPFNPDIYNACYHTWLGLSLEAVFRMITDKRGIFPDKVLESTEMALIDLQGKLFGRSATDLLGLPTSTPTPGLFCILQHEPERLRAAAETFLKRGPVTHVKLKLFGNEEHDAKLIRVLRETMGKNCFIAGDVNDGYERDLKKLTPILKHLADTGLNACEDPARMTWEEWHILQDSVPELHLIPDFPMRLAYETVNSAKPGPGMICNLHPDCMGSITAVIALAKRLKREKHPGYDRR
ncbi:MAG: hypothetical protein L6W00_30510 [Lentisphaeria bacterium]|nr:MAG: hypothetical protein L6W00_30510 [Lentisphaeria bacterium]